jgi:hypothetical protein
MTLRIIIAAKNNKIAISFFEKKKNKNSNTKRRRMRDKVRQR